MEYYGAVAKHSEQLNWCIFCLGWITKWMEVFVKSLTAIVGSGFFSYYFDHCIMRTSFNTTASTGHYISILKNVDPKFKNIISNDYRLNSDSPAGYLALVWCAASYKSVFTLFKV